MGAVNQALGRVIRHRRDYGTAVLVDARWTAKGSLRHKHLPLWLRSLLGIPDNARGEHLACPIDRLLHDLHEHFARLSAWHRRVVGTGMARPDVAGQNLACSF